MKRTETVEFEICDLCKVNHASEHTKCMGCGKAICYECRTTRAKEYSHAVYFSGSGDGLYCLECDERLLGSGDKVHAAYRLIASLRDEQTGWYEEFKRRSGKAEEDLKRLSDNGGESRG